MTNYSASDPLPKCSFRYIVHLFQFADVDIICTSLPGQPAQRNMISKCEMKVQMYMYMYCQQNIFGLRSEMPADHTCTLLCNNKLYTL